MSAPPAWQVDRDYLAGEALYVDGIGTRVGTAGGAPAGARRHLMTVRWRVLDDDGVIYYGGCATPAAVDADETDPGSLYAALEWAAADAGAVTLETRDAAGRWVAVFA